MYSVCKKRSAERRNHPQGTVVPGPLLGRSPPGQGAGKQGARRGGGFKQRSLRGKRSLRSLRGVRVGKGFYRALPGLPYKEENTGSAVIGVQGPRVIPD